MAGTVDPSATSQICTGPEGSGRHEANSTGQHSLSLYSIHMAWRGVDPAAHAPERQLHQHKWPHMRIPAAAAAQNRWSFCEGGQPCSHQLGSMNHPPLQR